MLIGSPQALFVWPPLPIGLMLPLSTICILSCVLFCAPKQVKGPGTCFIPKKLNNKGPSQGPSVVCGTFTRSCHLPQKTDRYKCSYATGKCKFWEFGHNLFKVAGLSNSYLAHEVTGSVYLQPVRISFWRPACVLLVLLLCFCVRADLCQCPQCQQQQAFRFTNPWTCTWLW